MPDTFGGEWHRPGEARGRDRQRGNSKVGLARNASFDNEPQTGCGGCLLIATICVTATTALLRLRKSGGA